MLTLYLLNYTNKRSISYQWIAYVDDLGAETNRVQRESTAKRAAFTRHTRCAYFAETLERLYYSAERSNR